MRHKRLLACALAAVAVFATLLSVYVRIHCRPAVDVNAFSVQESESADEVRSRYGPPSAMYDERDGDFVWLYYTDKYGLGFTSIGVRYDPAGKVRWSFNH